MHTSARGMAVPAMQTLVKLASQATSNRRKSSIGAWHQLAEMHAKIPIGGWHRLGKRMQTPTRRRR